MFIGNIKVFFLVLIFLKIRLLNAQGLPNFGSGGFGNPTSNYPMSGFFPFGNQNNQPVSGQPNQNPNYGNFQNMPTQGYPQGYPYQGSNMNPNYQQPAYPNNQNQGLPNQIGSPYQAPPNYQQSPYPNNPNNAIMYPDNINVPYQNGGTPLNQNQNYYQNPMTGQLVPGQYPVQNGQYPPQSNNNFSPGMINPNFRPDELNNNLLNSQIYFPGELPYQNQPNQYYPQNNYPNQNGQSFTPGSGAPTNIQTNFPNNTPGTNVQFPANSNLGASVNVPAGSTLTTGNFNQVPPQLPNTNDPNYNGTVAILGKPVIVTPAGTLPGQAVSGVSTENPTQKQCVQDCSSTSEYDPVCGSNNVTYINPGKFVCAQRCGEAIYLRQKGRCPGDIISNKQLT